MRNDVRALVLEPANGRDGVAIAQRERPDLLLIDLTLPGMDGYQAIAGLRWDLSRLSPVNALFRRPKAARA